MAFNREIHLYFTPRCWLGCLISQTIRLYFNWLSYMYLYRGVLTCVWGLFQFLHTWRFQRWGVKLGTSLVHIISKHLLLKWLIKQISCGCILSCSPYNCELNLFEDCENSRTVELERKFYSNSWNITYYRCNKDSQTATFSSITSFRLCSW